MTTSPQCPTTCDADSARTFAKDKYTFKGTVYMYPSDEKSIRQAIMQHGPVEAAFTVYADFENYVSGIYQHTSGAMLGGHAIRIVGWGTEGRRLLEGGQLVEPPLGREGVLSHHPWSEHGKGMRD